MTARAALRLGHRIHVLGRARGAGHAAQVAITAGPETALDMWAATVSFVITAQLLLQHPQSAMAGTGRAFMAAAANANYSSIIRALKQNMTRSGLAALLLSP